MKRAAHPIDGDIHILPVGDSREHVEDRDCWCVPQLQQHVSYPTPGIERVTVTIVHNSDDGRELIERHGVN